MSFNFYFLVLVAISPIDYRNQGEKAILVMLRIHKRFGKKNEIRSCWMMFHLLRDVLVDAGGISIFFLKNLSVGISEGIKTPEKLTFYYEKLVLLLN